MTMTDPVADLLTRLRNASSAHHDAVTLPSSTIKAGIAEILKREGYVSDWKVEPARVGKSLTITLKYGHEPRAAPVLYTHLNHPPKKKGVNSGAA